MKIRVILFIGFLSLIANDSLCQNWNKISKEIKKAQFDINPSEYVIWHYNLRKSSDCFNRLTIAKNDTIFLLEDESDYSSPTIALVAWNKSDTLTYYSENCYYNNHNGGNHYKSSDRIWFTKYIRKLVSEWEIAEIKKEERLNGDSLPQDWIFATRIILNDERYKIDCIRFKYFINFQRDSMDLSN